MKLDLVVYPDPMLRRISYEIPEKDIKTDAVQSLAKDMIETMKLNNGIGLSAPQIGKNIQLIVIDTSQYQPFLKGRSPMVMINPKIMFTDHSYTATMEEGCLSFPGELREVTRAQKIIVHYKDLNGEHKIDLFTGITAVCIQHEVDHLAGITMDDRQKEQSK